MRWTQQVSFYKVFGGLILITMYHCVITKKNLDYAAMSALFSAKFKRASTMKVLVFILMNMLWGARTFAQKL